MAAFPNLPNAPIHEAIVEIRITPTEKTQLSRLEGLANDLSAQYPTKNPTRKVESGFKIAPTPEIMEFRQSDIGFRLENADKNRIVQLRTDCFSFSWLRPYHSWEALVDSSRPIWEKYLDSAEPLAVTRVATRFVNRIELPFRDMDFDDYLTTAPIIPKELPQTFASFLSRSIVVLDKRETMGVITQSVESAIPDKNILPYILDIDIFREESFAPRAKEVWDLLEDLRVWKNKAFFGALTPKALELFQ